MNNTTKVVLLNVASVVSASVAISVACFATKSALPLFAYLIVPRWVYSFEHKATNNKEE